MPNWKKVIVSGSDASLNSLTVVNGVTGSLLGTASWANNATTASRALQANTSSYVQVAASSSYALSASIAQTAVTASYALASFPNNQIVSGTVSAIADTNPAQVFRITSGSSTFITVNSSGSTGIGTTSPQAILHSVGSGIVNIVQSSNTVSYTQYYNTSTGTGGTSDGLTVGVNGNDGFLFLREAANLILGTSGEEKMRITSVGSIGIGTNAPTAILHISSSMSASILRVDTAGGVGLFVSGSGNVGIATTNPSQRLTVGSADSDAILINVGGKLYFRDTSTQIFEGSGLNIVAGASRPIIFSADGSERARIAVGGNVGIGTTSPLQKLHIHSGSVFIVGGLAGSATQAYTASGRLIFNNDFTDIARGPNKVTLWDDSAGFRAGFGIHTSTVGYYSGQDHRFYRMTGTATSTITELMVISASSNVGIGMTTPTGSTLTVNGNVWATSFTGSLLGTASWANNVATSSFTSNAISASYALSASYAISASVAFNAVTTSLALNANTASFATLAANATSASFATSAANATSASYATFANTASSADNFNVRNTLTVTTIVAQTITSSTDFVTGSTRFGSLLSNTHQFTGSVSITGSLTSNGDVAIRGSGNTSATTALLVENSDGTDFLRARNDGRIILGSLAVGSAPFIQPNDGVNALNIDGSHLYFGNANTDNANSGPAGFTFDASFSAASSGQSKLLNLIGTFTGATGAEHTNLRLGYTINQAVGATGVTRGLYINPTLTRATDFRAIEWSNNASATSGSWGLYGAGSALNYLAGNLGIGVTIPTAKLHISGSNTDAILQINSPASASILVVSGSGNIGIGTASPSAKLQVTFPANTTNHVFKSEAGDNLLTLQTYPTTNRMQLLVGDYNGTASPNIAAISDTNTGIQWTGADILKFVNGGSENVTILANGNVGIGTTAPSSRLAVSGGIQAYLADAQGTVSIAVGEGTTGASSNNIVLETNTTNNTTRIYNSGTGTSLHIGSTGPTSDVLLSSVRDLYFKVNNGADVFAGTTAMFISASGNVGIGMSTPTGSRLTVNGNVFATSFTGSLFGTASWANNVISASYSTFAASASYALTASHALNGGGGAGGPSSGAAYTHTQASPSSTWTVPHNLNNLYPVVTVYDFSGNVVIPQNVSSSNANQTTITFSYGATGYATAVGAGIVSFTTASLATSASYALTASVLLGAITSASYSATASVVLGSVTSASYAVTSSFSRNFTVGSTFVFDQTLTDYGNVASSIVGSNNVFTQATGSYTSAFIKYTAASASNARAGEVIAVWNGGTTQFTDFSTVDVGTTTAVTASATIVTNDFQFNIQTNTSGWSIKSIITYI